MKSSIIAASFSMLILTASSALADDNVSQCSPYGLKDGATINVCLDRDIISTQEKEATVYGDVAVFEGSNHMTSLTVYVDRCNCQGDDPVNVAESHTSQTPTVAAAWGYCYKTCADITFQDGSHLDNVCSPLVPVP
jgi:hypothetical protein